MALTQLSDRVWLDLDDIRYVFEFVAGDEYREERERLLAVYFEKSNPAVAAEALSTRISMHRYDRCVWVGFKGAKNDGGNREWFFGEEAKSLCALLDQWRSR